MRRRERCRCEPAEPQLAAVDRRRIGKERQRRHDFDASRRYTAFRDAGSSRIDQEATRRRRGSLPRPLSREAFLSPRTDMERYDPRQSRRSGSASGRTSEPSTSRTPPPARTRTSVTGTSWRCCRTRRGRSTWGTSSTTRWATSRRTCAGGAAGACCARWASTRSACLPRMPRSATASIRARAPSATSSSCASR